MIYRKDANFPYPILSNTTNAYENNEFLLNISLQENGQFYRFHIETEIGSDYLKELVRQGKAVQIFVIQSKDNKFYEMRVDQTYVDISKDRISLNKRTNIQMLLMSKQEVCFEQNEDLTPFYDEVKKEVRIPKYSILGYSNVVIFDGSCKKPLQLFEKRINPEIKSDIKIEFGAETIIINYRNEELQFNDSSKCNQLNHHYVYMGLQKALYRFILNNREENEEDETIYLSEMEPPTDELDLKLYNLMVSKMVDEISLDNIDEVIYKITDRILEKFTVAVKGLYQNEN